MLPKPNRLPRQVFNQVKQQGKPIHGEFITLIVAATTSTPTRIGFIVSTKVASLATRRNRIKRLLRQAVRPLLASLKPGYNFIVIAKKTIINHTLPQLTHELKRLLQPYFSS